MGISKKPYTTIFIIAMCVLAFALQSKYPDITYSFGMYKGAIQNGDSIKLITSAFLHHGAIHLFTNMLSLLMLGMAFENSIGSKEMRIVYVYGILGSGLSINFFGGSGVHAGASGAIWALLTAILVYRLENKENCADMIKWLILNILFTFTVSGISWQGHLGGGVMGAIVMHGMMKCSNNICLFGGERRKNIGFW